MYAFMTKTHGTKKKKGRQEILPIYRDIYHFSRFFYIIELYI